MSLRWAAALVVLAAARVAVAAEPAPEMPPASTAPLQLAAPAPPSPATTLVMPLPPPPAPEDRRAVVAPIAGALTAVAPFAVGCGLWAQNGHVPTQEAGAVVMASGFALAPWVSHGVAGRWKRGALFGSFATGLAAATLTYMAFRDPFEAHYRNVQRVPFGILLTSTMFASAIGVFDSFMTAPPPREAP